MRLIVQTQIEENYGTAVTPFWKMKGGETYTRTLSQTVCLTDIKAEVKKFEKTLINNLGMIEYVIDWELEDY